METNTPKMSMLEKSYYKRKITREHSSNLRAGYVHINEDHLHKTGLRGRKQRFLHVVTGFLILLTLVNIGAASVLLYVLRVNTEGMASVQFDSLGEVQFTVVAKMEDVFLVQNEIQDLGQGLGIHSTDSDILLSSQGDGPKLTVGGDGLDVSDVESFQVVDPGSGKSVFHTDSFSLPSSVNSLSAQDLQLPGIISPRGQDLTLFTDGGYMSIAGSEDVTVKGKRIEVFADQSIHIDVENLSLSAPGGVYFDEVDHMTTVSADSIPEASVVSFQLCVCVHTGLLFQVPAGVRCDAASKTGTPHPCHI